MTPPTPSTGAAIQAEIVPGLPAAIDTVAASAAETHRFLRRQWFAAALSAYGGEARTVIVRADDVPALALPLVPVGPASLGIRTVPGCYWPFRGFPAHALADAAIHAAALGALRGVRALRIGPVYDDDPAVAPFLSAAKDAGWAVIDRVVARSFLLDMAAARAEGAWPRNSTLRKNRFHEKHLGEHGTLDWRMLDGADWPAAFEHLAVVEQQSWQADASDAKFGNGAHGRFWRAAATDPAIAAMFHAALLTVNDAPAAFSFDMDAGPLRYAIANSYAPAYAKHSPGKLLYYRNLVDAIDRGITRVDWGAGDSGYKRTIGAEPGPMIRDWLLIRSRPIGRVLASLWQRSGHDERD